MSRELTRRELLARGGRAALLLAGTGGVAAGLYRATAPSPREPGRVITGLPDYSRPGTAGRVAVVSGGDRAAAARMGFKAIGGMEALVGKGERVLIKVNAAFASPPAIGATTHPDLLRSVIALCRRAGAGEVLVTDNPIQDPAACFELTGLAGACAEGGARLRLPAAGDFLPFSLPGGRLLVEWPLLYAPLAGVDRIIGLAPVKDHHRSLASLSMKNWYGLLGGRRNVFHQDIFGIIAELGRMVRPTAVVLDGTVSMVRNGPTGGSLADLKPTGTVIVSTDQLAADVLGLELLGRDPSRVPYIAKAAAAGVGNPDPRALGPKRVRL